MGLVDATQRASVAQELSRNLFNGLGRVVSAEFPIFDVSETITRIGRHLLEPPLVRCFGLGSPRWHALHDAVLDR